jgi:signal transduction histidine kinase
LNWLCCWNKTEVTAEECPYIEDGEEELYTIRRRRVIEKCLECPRITEDLRLLQEIGVPFSELLPDLIAEILEQRSRLNSLDNFLSTRTREIKFLHELAIVLQTSLDLDEILSTALTAITAGKGFGMNRAFLLMADKGRNRLKGYLAIGPRNYEEAWQIWQEIDQDNISLTAMVRNFLKNKISSEKAKFHDVLERLSVSFEDHEHIFNRALEERRPILITDAFHNPDVTPELARVLGVDTFLIMPLISRNRRIGIILADNCITHKSITPQDMQSLEIFSLPVAFALERASLYEKVQEDLEKLTEANLKLKEQQDVIVRMEQMALVGRITSTIAHSIRNPLMVIGGFARSLLKNIEGSDIKREYLESIVNGARQLENVLDEVLDYSDSLYPSKDLWDVDHLLTVACRELEEDMAGRGITLSFVPSPELSMAYIDYKQIDFCVRSYLRNAMENLKAGDGIMVRTFLVGSDLIVEIRDTAECESAAETDDISQPVTMTREQGGGATLPLCRAVLERQNIPYTMERDPEGFRRLIVRLPRKKEESDNGKATGC